VPSALFCSGRALAAVSRRRLEVGGRRSSVSCGDSLPLVRLWELLFPWLAAMALYELPLRHSKKKSQADDLNQQGLFEFIFHKPPPRLPPNMISKRPLALPTSLSPSPPRPKFRITSCFVDRLSVAGRPLASLLPSRGLLPFFRLCRLKRPKTGGINCHGVTFYLRNVRIRQSRITFFCAPSGRPSATRRAVQYFFALVGSQAHKLC